MVPGYRVPIFSVSLWFPFYFWEKEKNGDMVAWHHFLRFFYRGRPSAGKVSPPSCTNAFQAIWNQPNVA